VQQSGQSPRLPHHLHRLILLHLHRRLYRLKKLMLCLPYQQPYRLHHLRSLRL
jgi:hypothetical protein